PAESSFKQRVQAPAYPVREAGDLIWVYLGPPELEPPFPDYPWFHVPAEYRSPTKAVYDCNYVQILEGGIDSSHVGVLHLGNLLKPKNGSGPDSEEALRGRQIAFPSNDDAPVLEAETTDFGFHYAAIRRHSTDPTL